MHLPTGNTSKGKGPGLHTSCMKKIFALCFIPCHFDELGVSAPDGHTGLRCGFPIHALPQVFSSFQRKCVIELLVNLSSMAALPSLSSFSFLHGSFLPPKRQLLWTAPLHPSPQRGLQRTSYEPECSTMARVGFSLHGRGDCGLHLSSKKKMSAVCFLYISAL